MPPCLDVYVWLRTSDRAAVLSRFIDRYVSIEQPREPRFPAFVRTHVNGKPAPGDVEALMDLRRDDAAMNAFSIYLQAATYYQAIITITEEGDVVLGLSLDDADDAPETMDEASTLMTSLRQEFHSDRGVAGVELAPPQSEAEWAEDAQVLLREGPH